MKFRVHTQSGSAYVIDNDNLTYKRIGSVPLRGLQMPDEGTLAGPAVIIMGQPLWLDLENEQFIRSTIVVLAEMIS
jgi:hypothetical protein